MGCNPRNVPKWRITGRLRLAHVALQHFNIDEALRKVNEALELVEPQTAPTLHARVLSFLGGILTTSRLYTKAKDALQQSLAFIKQTDDVPHQITILLNLGHADILSGDLAHARSWYTQALELVKSIGGLRAQGECQSGLGRIEAQEGRIAEAIAHHEAALRVYRQTGDKVLEAQVHWGIAYEILQHSHAAARAALLPVALDHLAQASSILKETGVAQSPRYAGYLDTAIKIQMLAGNHETAKGLAREMVALADGFGDEARWAPDTRENVEYARSMLEGKAPADPSPSTFIGSSPAMKSLRSTVDKVAASNVDVLILGETGTGKELVAQAIHRQSKRARKPFVAVNCGALTETLLESELFGHEKGAFTGADTRKIGLMETASGGTLFLDEIGEMPLSMQVKLLRALQERKIRRVGGTSEVEIDIRVIAATVRDLDEAVKSGSFRGDLYYRINVMRIETSPLRERGKDIAVLAEHFLASFSAEFGGKVFQFAPDTLEAIARHNWPGNVRELMNAIRSAMAMSEDGTLRQKHFRALAANQAQPGTVDPSELERKHESDERNMLVSLLTAHQGNATDAAKAGGFAQRTFYRMLKQHRLKASDFKPRRNP